MGRKLIIVGIVAAALVAGWWGYTTFFAPAEPAVEPDTAAEVDDLQNVIWASGELRPVVWAGLSPVNSGIVQTILVAEGDQVEPDQLLLELDTGILQNAVAQAEAAVAEAQAALAKLQAGATAAQIAAAEAQVAAARAGVALAAGQMLETQGAIDIAAAQVAIAEAQYAELASHPTQTEANVARAEAAIAEAVVSQAQAAYNLVRGDPQIAARPEALRLQEATAQLEAARARTALTTDGPTAEQLAVARSQISAARAQLSAAESRAPSAEASVQSALAAQASAQANLDNLLAGATVEEIAMAEARVQSARAALATSQANLRLSQVTAPFAGQVGAVNVRLGEMTSPATPALLLGDTAQMIVETTDLRETDVVRLRLGMPVEVTFDALPGRAFQGEIIHIAPVSTTEQGSTNFTVRIDVADLDESLRWGMTAFVNIQAPR